MYILHSPLTFYIAPNGILVLLEVLLKVLLKVFAATGRKGMLVFEDAILRSDCAHS
jgi:hypothetical protein